MSLVVSSTQRRRRELNAATASSTATRTGSKSPPNMAMRHALKYVSRSLTGVLPPSPLRARSHAPVVGLQEDFSRIPVGLHGCPTTRVRTRGGLFTTPPVFITKKAVPTGTASRLFSCMDFFCELPRGTRRAGKNVRRRREKTDERLDSCRTDKRRYHPLANPHDSWRSGHA